MSRKVINVVMGGGNDIKYYDVSSLDSNEASQLSGFKILQKVKYNGAITISPYFPVGDILAIAIDWNLMIVSIGGKQQTIKEYLIEVGEYDRIVSYPELTKEQFYDTTLPTE
jgi:hypothetical protein